MQVLIYFPTGNVSTLHENEKKTREINVRAKIIGQLLFAFVNYELKRKNETETKTLNHKKKKTKCINDCFKCLIVIAPRFKRIDFKANITIKHVVLTLRTKPRVTNKQKKC